MKTNITLNCLALALLLGIGATSTQAAFTLSVTQQGPDVVFNGSGTLDTSALTLEDSDVGTPPFEISANGGFLLSGFSSPDVYSGIAGPTNFGSGGPTTATSTTGDLAGVRAGNGTLLFVPTGYVSGTALTNSATFVNTTFADLGFTPGTYTYTWGSGTSADSLTIIGGVPEPSTWALMSVGVGLLACGVARRRHTGVA